MRIYQSVAYGVTLLLVGLLTAGSVQAQRPRIQKVQKIQQPEKVYDVKELYNIDALDLTRLYKKEWKTRA